MPRPKKTEIEQPPVVVEIGTREWKEDTPYLLPIELQPFVEDSDKFFSPLKQKAMAEKRRDVEWAKAAKEAEESGFVGTEAAAVLIERARPTIITSGFDLLILKEKREDAKRRGVHEDLCPDFSVCGRTAGLDSPNYELVLAAAISTIESCLYLEDAEGNPKPGWAIAHNLRIVGWPLPEPYSYLSIDSPPSYWPDADKYAYLLELRYRVIEEA